MAQLRPVSIPDIGGRGKPLPPDRFWNDGIESLIAADDEGPCMGIELNIWERAKVGILVLYNMLIDITLIMHIKHIIYLISDAAQ